MGQVDQGKEDHVPSPHPPEFRRRAVELARTGDKSISVLAKGLGISQSCLSNWVRQADRDEGVRNDGGLTTAEKKDDEHNEDRYGFLSYASLDLDEFAPFEISEPDFREALRGLTPFNRQWM